MIQLVVFDMAGTTVDEDNVVYKTVRAAINAAGYQFTQEQVQLAGAGKEKSQAIRDVLALDGNSHSEEEVTTIFSDFKARLVKAYETLDVKEQPTTTATFESLRAQGVKVVLNTGYDQQTAGDLICKIGWKVGEHIDGVVTASDVENSRPHPEMIEKAMSICEINSADAVAKVGDSKIDIEEGKNAGCKLTFGVTTGAQTREQLLEASPSYIIDQLSELLPIIQEN